MVIVYHTTQNVCRFSHQIQKEYYHTVPQANVFLGKPYVAYR